MTNGRNRAARALATLCLTGLGGAVLTAAPSTADPSIDEVEDRVDRLYHEAEQASERYNDARIDLTDARERLRALQADLERQRTRVDAVRDQVAAGVVAQYQGQAMSTVSQVVLSDDPDAFLSQLTTVSEYHAGQAAVVADLAVEADRLELRQDVAERELEAISRARAQLAREKAAIDERMDEAEELLGRLQQEERERRVSRDETRNPAPTAPTSEAPAAPPADAPASGSAAAAVGYAMAQVGDAYVFGAAGPSAFDCSGLTMMAWAAAGVGLPHSSSAQMGSGTPVSTSALQPGDLVFYYSPVSHVGIYVGNGMLVHAANPSTGVRMDPVGSMPISGAVRPG